MTGSGTESRAKHSDVDHAPSRSSMVWFVVLFVVYLVVGVVLIDLPWIERWLIDPWTRFNATAAAACASLIGVETVASGTSVETDAARLDILGGCNGAHAVLILLSSILAFPAPWARRIVGAAVGTVLVFGFNVVRLVNLIVVAHHFPERLELFHVYIWQTLIILIAFALFLVWGTFFAERRPGTDASSPS